ncbi:MAG TPA: hypothetical protein VEB42_00730, partial [Chitinophagaceae bacterium]|nr:hypothetical protein [Chitinophagaceae bacterium]
MTAIKKLLIVSVLLLGYTNCPAQRTYKANSVLATGNWYRFAVSAPGVYKIDLPFLASLGINGPVNASQVRIFGNGGGMLPEASGEKPIDDLQENSIMVVDGGDGILNGSDYLLFFATGPHQWVKDSINQTFSHKKNIYSERAFYYITVGGTGLRIPTQQSTPQAGTTVNSFSERFFHELDTVNFLASGKEWYGEEFSGAPGRTLVRTFSLPYQDWLPQQASMVTNVAARSVNVPSRFALRINNLDLAQMNVPQISPAQYDLFAQEAWRMDQFLSPGGSTTITFTYVPGSFNSQGWLNWFEYFGRRPLTLSQGSQTLFRDWNSVGSGAVE